MDISKYFRESLGLRNNKSQLYTKFTLSIGTPSLLTNLFSNLNKYILLPVDVSINCSVANSADPDQMLHSALLI